MIESESKKEAACCRVWNKPQNTCQTILQMCLFVHATNRGLSSAGYATVSEYQRPNVRMNCSLL